MNRDFYRPLFILLGVIGFCFLILPANAVWVTDVGIKSIFSQSLLLNSFKSTDIVYPGKFMDLPLNFSPLPQPEFFSQNGKIHTVVNFFYPALNAISIKTFGFAGIYLLSYLALIFTFVFSYFALRDLFEIARPGLGALLICLGTPLFFYGITGWEYDLAALFILIGFFLMGRGENRQKLVWYFWSGAFYGMACWWREEAYLITFALYLSYFFWGKKRSSLLLSALGALTFLLILWLIQSTLGEGLFGAHLQHYLAEKSKLGFSDFLLIKSLIAYDWLISAHQNIWVNLVLFMLVISPLAISRFVQSKKMSPIWWGFAAMGFFLYFVLLLLNRDYFYNTQFTGGIIFSAPLFLFALMNSETSLNARSRGFEAQLCSGIIISISLLVLAASAKSGRGMHIGARHLIPLYPLIGLLAWSKLHKFLQRLIANKEKLTAALIVIILLMSVGLQAYSGVILGMKKFYSQQVIETLKEERSPFVITNIWWLPVEMSSIFYEKNFFYFGNMAKMELLIKRIARIERKNFLYVTSPHYPNSIPPKHLRDKWQVEIMAIRDLETPRMKFLNMRLINFRFKKN